MFEKRLPTLSESIDIPQVKCDEIISFLSSASTEMKTCSFILWFDCVNSVYWDMLFDYILLIAKPQVLY